MTLIKRFDEYDAGHLADILMIVAADVEDALMMCDDDYEEKYTSKDIFTMATSLVTAAITSGELKLQDIGKNPMFSGYRGILGISEIETD